jgi:SsrA-binding protein
MSDLVSNRRAGYEYEILETFEAGLSLLGTEIKSLRGNGGSLQDAYVDIRGGEAILVNASIAPYAQGNIHNHEERRERKLLLNRSELARLYKAKAEKGLTIIVLSIYLSKKGWAKAKIAVARGKKEHDKREAIKEREVKRSIQRGEES